MISEGGILTSMLDSRIRGEGRESLSGRPKEADADCLPTSSQNCPICECNAEPHFEGLYDDRYGYVGEFRLWRCQQCGHSFLGASFSAKLLGDLYSTYYPRSKLSLDEYKPYEERTGLWAWLDGELCSAFRWVPRNVRVLDVGCGFGEALGYHQARGCDVYGVEADENIRRVAEKFGYKVHIGLFDPNAYEGEFFDYVAMDQVIEHVGDPLKVLCGVARVLKQGGVAILSTPNPIGWGARIFGRRWINWHVPYHLQYFTRKSMSLAAERTGLCLERVQTTTSSAWLYYQWIHVVLYPRQGEPSPFWLIRGNQRFGIKATLKLFSLTHHLKINHLLTRLADVLGIGDNHLFFLRKKHE